MNQASGSLAAEHSTSAGLNWAGNYRYGAAVLYRPRDVAEVQEIVRNSPKVKALGSRHSFNDIADSPSVQISTENLNAEVVIDPAAMTVTIESGLRYGHFCSHLHDHGFVLHNLASLPHISVAGACSTATHGSGVHNGNLATAVSEMEFVDGTGGIVTLSRDRDADVFNGAVVGLGAIGIVTRLKLKIEKSFAVTQNVFEELPVEELRENFDAIMSAGYSVSLFTTWRHGFVDQVWLKRRADANDTPLGSEFYGAKAASENVHPIRGISAENCTDQLCVPGPWYERLPHFRMGYTPSSGEELQSEYFVAMENAVDALRAIEKIGDGYVPFF